MKLDVTLTGSEQVRRTLLQIGRQAGRQVLAQTAEDVELYVGEQAGKHTRTGALFRSVYMRRVGEAWEIGHDLQVAPQALFVHWGTKAHDIRPRLDGIYKSFKDIDGKSVRKGIPKGGRGRTTLRWASGGQFFFAKLVHHPGYKGDPWLVRAAQQAPLIFERHLAAHLARTTGA